MFKSGRTKPAGGALPFKEIWRSTLRRLTLSLQNCLIWTVRLDPQWRR